MPTAREAERRQLSVMFCDLVGSTRLAGRLDPEDLREVTRAYQEAAGVAIRKLGGHIAQLLGDGILVYFGYPNAHEDDAQRAGRAGLAIIEAIRELNVRIRREVGIELAVRIGIHTGTTVVGAMGDDQHSEQLAIGETPNIAARLQGLAEPNTVVISSMTARLMRGQFECDDLGVHELAGVAAPMRVYRLVRATSGPGRLMTVADDALTPLVGRDSDLATLQKSWKDCCTARGQSVIITGEAGIGKSRLVHSFGVSLSGQEHIWLGCRCSPFYTGTAFRPIIEMLQGLFALADDDDAEAELAKMEVGLAAVGLDQITAVPLLAPLLAISAPATRYPPLALSPQIRKQKTQELLIDILRRLASQKPLVFALEDLHWVDRSTLDLLEQLRDILPEVKILALFTARSQAQQVWPADAHIALGRIPDSRVIEMVAAVAGNRSLPQQVVRLIVAKADGNPLYIEELTQMLLESGQLVERDGAYQLAVALPSLEIPATLRDSLMARLDRLPQAKQICQVGATIGREFEHALVRDVLGLSDAELASELEQLTEAGILLQRGAQPNAIYVFRHALLQDAAYGSLLRRTRQQYNSRIAELLERDAPDTPPEVLAHHYTEAGRPEKAIAYWQTAGQAALQSWALAEATQHLERGLALIGDLPDSPARALDELSLRVAIGVPLMLTRGFAAPDVEATYRRAFELCADVGDSAADRLFPALYGLWIYYQVKALYPKAEEMGERLLELARRSGDSSIEIGALHALGASRFWRGQVGQARDDLEQALAIYDAETHGPLAFMFGQDVRVFCLAMLIWVHWHDGDIEKARACRQEALDWCAELGQPGSQGFVELLVATFHCLMGEHELAQEHSRKLIALSQEQGMPHWEACGRITLGWSMIGGDQPEVGAETIRAGLDALSIVGTRTASSFWKSAQVNAELARGNVGEARRALGELVDFIADSDESCLEAEIIRLDGELILAEQRDRADGNEQAAGNQARQLAASSFQRALDLARDHGAKILAQRAEASLAGLSGTSSTSSTVHLVNLANLE